MKKLIFALIVFSSSYSIADDFICRHQGPGGTEYVVEYINGSICMQWIDTDGAQVKFNLFPAPSPQEENNLIVFRDDENSFRLSLSHYPNSNEPAYGEVVHTNDDGEVIPENMSTYCQ